MKTQANDIAGHAAVGAPRAADPSLLLSIRHLRVDPPPSPRLRRGTAPLPDREAWVEDFHIDLKEREVLAVLGDADSGRSELALALVGRLPLKHGSVRYRNEEVALGQEQPAAKVARKPFNRLAEQTGVTLIRPRPFATFTRKQLKQSAFDWLDQAMLEVMPKALEEQRFGQLSRLLTRVGLVGADLYRPLSFYDDSVAARLALARALLTPLRLLICDEPVGEYDAAPFAALVKVLHQELRFALIYCTSDLNLIRDFAPRAVCMYRGKVIETAPTREFFERPRHPHLRLRLGDEALLKALIEHPPEDNGEHRGPTMGCNFHPRCPLADPLCVRGVPNLRKVGRDHFAACHFVAAEVERFG